jgi:hypothetical protein
MARPCSTYSLERPVYAFVNLAAAFSAAMLRSLYDACGTTCAGTGSFDTEQREELA